MDEAICAPDWRMDPKTSGSDFTMVVTETKYYLHEVVLTSTSEYFRGLFRTGGRECSKREVELRVNCKEEADAVPFLLECMYGFDGKREPPSPTIESIVYSYGLADYFATIGVQVKIAKFVKDLLRPNNLGKVLELVQAFEMADLKALVVEKCVSIDDIPAAVMEAADVQFWFDLRAKYVEQQGGPSKIFYDRAALTDRTAANVTAYWSVHFRMAHISFRLDERCDIVEEPVPIDEIFLLDENANVMLFRKDFSSRILEALSEIVLRSLPHVSLKDWHETFEPNQLVLAIQQSVAAQLAEAESPKVSCQLISLEHPFDTFLSEEDFLRRVTAAVASKEPIPTFGIQLLSDDENIEKFFDFFALQAGTLNNFTKSNGAIVDDDDDDTHYSISEDDATHSTISDADDVHSEDDGDSKQSAKCPSLS